MAMADKESTHVQQIRDAWRKAFADQADRVEAVFGEMAKFEEKGLEHATNNMEEATRLAKVSMAYATELSAQWRKLFVDATKRTADAISGQGA
jgi:hypothetical protein